MMFTRAHANTHVAIKTLATVSVANVFQESYNNFKAVLDILQIERFKEAVPKARLSVAVDIKAQRLMLGQLDAGVYDL